MRLGRARAKTLILIAVALVAAVSVSVAVRRALSKAPQPSCRSHVKQLALAMLMYASDLRGYLGPVEQKQRDDCVANLKRLAAALRMYAADNDGRLPVSPDARFLAGDLAPYDERFADDFYCPADPGWGKPSRARPGSPLGGLPRSRPKTPSYEWNAALAGRKTTKLPRPSPWVLHDRAPWHGGYRAEVFLNGTWTVQP